MKARAVILFAAAVLPLTLCATWAVSASEKKLPAGFVKGDIISYSCVPNKYWSRTEAMGIMPYLWKYALMCEFR